MVKKVRDVNEQFKEEKIELDVKEPYIFALHVLDNASELGEIREKENRVLAQGPVEKIEVVFDIVKKLDKKSKLIIKIEATGQKSEQKSHLNITLRPILNIQFTADEGVLQESFDEFYKKNLLPEMRKLSKKHIKKTIKEFEKQIKDISEDFE